MRIWGQSLFSHLWETGDRPFGDTCLIRAQASKKPKIGIDRSRKMW